MNEDREQRLHSRVTTAHTLCAVAETQGRKGDLEKARRTISVIRTLVREIGTLMDEPPQLSPDAVRELSGFFREVEHRMRNLEQVLQFDG